MRAVDESMALLRIVRETALEPEYAAVSGEGRHVSGLRHGAGILVVTTVMGALVGTMGVAMARQQPLAAAERQHLLGRVQTADQKVGRLRDEIEVSRQQLRQAQADALDGESNILLRLHDALQMSAGAIPLTGPGLVIEMDDSPDVDTVGEKGRVLDVDIRRVVNGLWQAGAEAIAINGHPITAQTSIRAAGNAITVGYRSLTSPYRIEAIGDPLTIQGRFADTSGAVWASTLSHNYGISLQISTSDRVTVPADSKVGLRHAEGK